ncbi:MAG TPA: magnesium transporter CorA family protein [Salinarimonas sp.]|nr:magnesium transporter CorA family protein [Salinarimonas sp.]
MYAVTAVPSAGLERHLLSDAQPIPADALWIDLVEPTRAEDVKVEAFLGIAIPTREEMLDIEPSEIMYQEDGALYMTARLLCRSETDEPVLSGVTFILKAGRLVTVRYEDPRAFAMFAQRASRPGTCGVTAEGIMAGLVDTIIDRAADVLQITGERIDAHSRAIFAPSRGGKKAGRRHRTEYRATLEALGRFGDLISKQRESLVSLERVLLFLTVAYRTIRVPPELRENVRTTLRDLQSLEEHATFQSSKIQFLLEATLGLVNLEQNNIIKLFSVVSVVFMPPTLIASIYGMNFKLMPELDWTLGYPMALVMMVVAAVLPYLLFRWKGWL